MRTHSFLLLLTSLLLLGACKKKSDKPEGDNTFYFRATINGQQVNLTASVPKNNEFVVGSTTKANRNFTGTQWVTDYYRGAQITKLTGINQEPPEGSLYILKRVNDYDPTIAQEEAMFKVGAYTYGNSNIGGTTTEGAVVEYIDATGEYWSSEGGSQAGSTFAITTIIPNTSGYSEKIFTATFNCKLYNVMDPSKPALTLTNGTMRGTLF